MSFNRNLFIYLILKASHSNVTRVRRIVLLLNPTKVLLLLCNQYRDGITGHSSQICPASDSWPTSNWNMSSILTHWQKSTNLHFANCRLPSSEKVVRKWVHNVLTIHKNIVTDMSTIFNQIFCNGEISKSYFQSDNKKWLIWAY